MHTDSNSPDPDSVGPLDRLRHGYAPNKPATQQPPDPLSDVVSDIVQNVTATARAELRLLEARAAMVKHGAQRAAIWGFIAASALLVALLALAFGAILILATYIGPLLATVIVFAALLLLAAFASFRSRRSAADVTAAFQSEALAGSIEENDV